MQSVNLLGTITSQGVAGEYIGNAIRADGWYGRNDHFYTIACYVSNLQGTVFFEASLADNPTSSDWFSVIDPITYPRTNLQSGETSALSFTFKANITWIRARVIQTGTGFVDRVLLNQ